MTVCALPEFSFVRRFNRPNFGGGSPPHDPAGEIVASPICRGLCPIKLHHSQPLVASAREPAGAIPGQGASSTGMTGGYQRRQEQDSAHNVTYLALSPLKTTKMNNGPIDRSNREMPNKPGTIRFGTWMIVTFSGHALGLAIFTGLVGLAWGIPPGKLLVPYAMLAYCGLVLCPLLYWARLSRNRPKSCAIRFAIAMFLYLQTLMLALGFGAIRLGILTKADAIDGYGPFMLPFSAFAAVLVYFVVRQMFTDLQSERP